MNTLNTTEDRLIEIKNLIETLNTTQYKLMEISNLLESIINKDIDIIYNGVGISQLDFDNLISTHIDDEGYNDLSEMIFDFLLLSNGNYLKTKLTRSSLENVNFNDVNFINSIMFNAKFDNSIFNITFFNNTYFTLASLVNCKFSNCSFSKCNFKYADLRFAKFNYCDFTDLQNLATCDCRGTNFTDCVNFPYENKTEFIIALNNYGGKADENTLWIDGTSLLT